MEEIDIELCMKMRPQIMGYNVDSFIIITAVLSMIRKTKQDVLLDATLDEDEDVLLDATLDEDEDVLIDATLDEDEDCIFVHKKDNSGYMNNFYMDRYCSFKIDDDGRIVQFQTEDDWAGPLPPIIGQLDKLTDVTLLRLNYIPAVLLSNLPNLEKLRFCHCEFEMQSDLHEKLELKKFHEIYEWGSKLFGTSLSFFQWIDDELELKNLKKLHVEDCSFGKSSVFAKWLNNLPMVESLVFENIQQCEIDSIMNTFRNVDALVKSHCKFKDNLQFCAVLNCDIDNTRFETLWMNILPKFPNVSRLDLRGNKIDNVLINSHKPFVSNKIRTLGFDANPICSKLWSPDFQVEILNFLQHHPTIYRLRISYKDEYYTDVEINNLLRMNHAGRRIMAEEQFPPSILPLVVSRAYNTSDLIGYDRDRYLVKQEKYNALVERTCLHNKNPTGVYYLIREYLAGHAMFDVQKKQVYKNEQDHTESMELFDDNEKDLFKSMELFDDNEQDLNDYMDNELDFPDDTYCSDLNDVIAYKKLRVIGE